MIIHETPEKIISDQINKLKLLEVCGVVTVLSDSTYAILETKIYTYLKTKFGIKDHYPSRHSTDKSVYTDAFMRILFSLRNTGHIEIDLSSLPMKYKLGEL